MNATSDMEYASKTHVSRSMDEILDSIMRADLNACDRRRERFARAKKQRSVSRRLEALYAECPSFRHCTLRNFEVPTKNQLTTRNQLQEIGNSIADFIDSGRQLFIWGKVGTGKDHLAISLLRRAVFSAYDVAWREGLTVYREIADAYKSGSSPEAVIRRLVRPRVLCLSDPVFRKGMTDSNHKTLQAIVRDRYDLGRPTWVTCNVADLDQARLLFGEDVLDRLHHRSTVIHCDWKSYRGQA